MRYGVFVSALILAPLIFPSSSFALELRTIKHPDSRIKQLWFPEVTQFTSSNPEELAKVFLSEHASEFGIHPKLQDLKLVRRQESLLGTHLHYSQFTAGLNVDTASIVVSVLKDSSRIYHVYSTVRPQSELKLVSKVGIGLETAYDKAWEHLGVSGDLMAEPKGELILRDIGKALLPVYRLQLHTTAPYGAWEVDVDAENGKIVEVVDHRINLQNRPLPQFYGKRKATRDRQKAFAKWAASKKPAFFAEGERAQGLGRVFEPDPRTSLNRRALEDNNAEADFNDAYFERVLPDISLSAGVYSLKGPWVRIIDFDPPSTPPATTSDGKWLFKRGQNGFNDAMTYYHIDKSQRYIQSLGFKDETGIQFQGIDADSDGVGGDDNSYFQPTTNRLSFGHGCVDDNEDADVILHEYGHAINFSINSNWRGGDTGAMGEGFGDYWAASYSYDSKAGQDFFPFEIYTWDGQGSNKCWPGRRMNASAARYDASRQYGAHSSIPGGFQSDELWATPIFQAHVALRSQGVPRSEIDQIVLQAQFGLGFSVLMPEMAQSIVATAQLLFPNGPHAEAFRQQFLHHEILKEPKAVLALDLKSFANPGKTVDLEFELANSGDLEAANAELHLSSDDPHVRIETVTVDFGDVAAGKAVKGFARVEITDDASCGEKLELKAELAYNNGKEATFTLPLQLGKAIGMDVVNAETIAIPDNKPAGITSTIEVNSTVKVTENLQIPVDISHSYRGDLQVTLTSPGGKSVILHKRKGSSENDISGIYPTTLTAEESLAALIGEDQGGTWTLTVADLASSDVGQLKSWGIQDVNSYECE